MSGQSADASHAQRQSIDHGEGDGLPGLLRPAPTPRSAALARLAASRQRLRNHLIPPPPVRYRPLDGRPGARSVWLKGLVTGPWRYLRDKLRGNPLGEAVVDGISQWWIRHPLRDAAETVASEAQAEWQRKGAPLVRRHPIASVLLAGLAGSALVAARPWRSPRVSAQIRPMPRRFVSWLFAQVPLQTVLSSLAVMLAGRGNDDESAGAAGPFTPDPTSPPAP